MHKTLQEKNAAYKIWIDRPTRAKRMECGRLQNEAQNVCRKRKRTHVDNRITDIEEASRTNKSGMHTRRMDH